MPDAWSLTGDYFEACNCDVGCPCIFLSDPTHGNCTVLIGWHIQKGRSGQETLDGLNFAIAATTARQHDDDQMGGRGLPRREGHSEST